MRWNVRCQVWYRWGWQTTHGVEVAYATCANLLGYTDSGGASVGWSAFISQRSVRGRQKYSK